MEEQKVNAEIDMTDNLPSQQKNENRSSFWYSLLAVVGAFIGVGVLINIVSVWLVSAGSISEGFSLLTSYSIQFATTIVFAWWLFHNRGFKFKLGWSLNGVNPLLILYGVVLMVLSSVMVEPLMEFMPKELLNAMNSFVIKSGWWGMATAVVLSPILEEILFRGILQGAAQQRYGAFRAIIISAAVFGIIHLIPQQVIYAFIAGIILGYVYYRTQSLFTVIIIHAINNAIAYLQTSIMGDNSLALKDLITNQTAYWVVYIICTLLVLISLWMLLRQIAVSVNNNKQ